MTQLAMSSSNPVSHKDKGVGEPMPTVHDSRIWCQLVTLSPISSKTSNLFVIMLFFKLNLKFNIFHWHVNKQCRSYFMFHELDVDSAESIFKYLPLLSFTESYIYQVLYPENWSKFLLGMKWAPTSISSQILS